MNIRKYLPSKLNSRGIYLDKSLPFLGKDVIKVFTGQRRVGKSYMLFQLAKFILKQDAKANIQYINKELDEFRSIRNDQDIMSYLQSRDTGVNNILMVDEVQEIECFEDALRSLLASKRWDIWVTGSNASMFSSDIAGKLSGRHVEIKIHSLSFLEFLDFHNFENSDENLAKYLKYGGLPYLINLELNDSIVFEYLKNIYSTILYKDIIQRHNVRNSRFLEDLVLFVADNTGSIFSSKSISDFLKSQGTNIPPNLVLEYMKHITDAFLLHQVKRSDLQGKRIFEVGEKYYFNDLGLRHAIKGFLPNDIGKIIENVILLHLKICNFEIYTGLEKDKEVDFVCRKNGNKIYIQAAYQISSDKVFGREYGNLQLINDNFPKYVVTMDPVKWDSYDGIQHVQLRDFLSNASCLDFI
jgi:predicted AAA+ superfamily ATPase